jgi:hypothetical protein
VGEQDAGSGCRNLSVYQYNSKLKNKIPWLQIQKPGYELIQTPQNGPQFSNRPQRVLNKEIHKIVLGTSKERGSAKVIEAADSVPQRIVIPQVIMLRITRGDVVLVVENIEVDALGEV